MLNLTVNYVSVIAGIGRDDLADYRHQFGAAIDRVTISYDDLTEAQQRLLDSATASLDSFTWKHLRKRFQMLEPPGRDKVFISYRKGHEALASALASRLGGEGFEPWFDEWDTGGRLTAGED